MPIPTKPDLAEALQRMITAGIKIDDIAELCGVKTEAVIQWIAKQSHVKGKSRLGVLMICRYRGIDCADELTCGQAIIEAGELLILGLANAEEMVRDIKLPDIGSLISYLGVKENTSPERYALFEAFVSDPSRRQALASAIENKSILQSPTSDEHPSVAITTPLEALSKTELMKIFCSAIDIASLTGKIIASLHTFADTLTMLLSETARRSVMNGS